MNLSRIIFLLIVLLSTGQFTACKFDLFDEVEYIYPEISIQNFEQLGDTTYVEVNVEDNGEPVELIGIVYKKDEAPIIDDEQTIFEGGSGVFRLPIPDLKAESEYFFMTFAGNGYAYAESEIKSFNVPLGTSPTVPCELEENLIKLSGASYPLDNIRFEQDDEYVISASAPQLSIRVFFGEAPTSDVYITTNETSVWGLGDKEVRIEVTSFNWRIARSGGEVYVNKKGENQYEIDFCDLMIFFGAEVELKGNISF